jgi:FkbM family methyltransferase
MIDQLLTRARKLGLIMATPSYRRALRRGVAASTEHHHDPLPPDLRTVIDVGANRGQFAVVARERWPAAKLICFEPLPQAAAVLRRVVGENADVEMVEAAVSFAPGTATIHVSRSDDSSSLLAITNRQSVTFPGTDEVATVDVPTTSLDHHLDGALARPALLKLDVQGFELEVLRGAEKTLSSVDFVVVECSFQEFYAGQAKADDVVRFLHGHGFSLLTATAPSVDRHGVVLQLDFIFERRVESSTRRR